MTLFNVCKKFPMIAGRKCDRQMRGVAVLLNHRILFDWGKPKGRFARSLFSIRWDVLGYENGTQTWITVDVLRLFFYVKIYRINNSIKPMIPAQKQPRCRDLDDIQAVTDSTDHLHSLCPDCEARMTVRDSYVEKDCSPGESLTRFLLQCPMCLGTGQRKVYWNTSERNKFKP